MSTFYMKQNDTSPAIKIECADGDDTVIPVTGATVKFFMRASDGTVKVNGDGVVVDGPNGIIQYDWDGGAGDTDTVGVFNAEFQVTFSGGEIETFPNKGYISIVIGDDIA